MWLSYSLHQTIAAWPPAFGPGLGQCEDSFPCTAWLRPSNAFDDYRQPVKYLCDQRGLPGFGRIPARQGDL